MVRLVIPDVDGTLVTREKVLTERTRAAVGQMRVAGIEFAITSGRPPRVMQMLIQPLALTTPIAALKMLGIPTDQIATIGDMPNDVAMFERSGVSIAIGQANDEVKFAATYCTTSSEEKGFATAVDRYVLNSRR